MKKAKFALALLLINSISHTSDEISLPSSLSVDDIAIPKRFFLLGIATASLLYAGYNLHDLIHQKDQDETAKKTRSPQRISSQTKSNTFIKASYAIAFGSLAAYLCYVCSKSIIKDYIKKP